MPQVQVQLVRGTGPSSLAIALFGGGAAPDGTGYSHADSVIQTGQYTGCLVGARSDSVPRGYPVGVQIRPPTYGTTSPHRIGSQEAWARRDRYTIPCTLDQQEHWQDFLLAQVSDGYDSEDILGFLFGTHWHLPGHWICSALAAKALVVAEIIKPPAGLIDKVDPNTLAFMISSAGATLQPDPPIQLLPATA